MPTYETKALFDKAYARLTLDQQETFKRAVPKLVHDLRRGAFRKGLRVKRVQGNPGVWEMTWADDGRATFEYGASVIPGEPHIIWRRIGGHEIFDNP
ncbi:MAG: hypothetical protein ACRDJW_09575 [Thermomicrobiales bacterium]